MAVVPREHWIGYAAKVLDGDFEDHEILLRIERFCACCGEWTEWDYVEDRGRLWGRCGSCLYLAVRLPKTYFRNSADNPVHLAEKVIVVKPRYFEVCRDKQLDIGLPPLPPGAVEAVPAWKRIGPAVSREAGPAERIER